MDKICPKWVFPVKNGRSEHNHPILNIRNSLGTKLQPKLTILVFWTKFVQKSCFRSKTAKATIEFCIFELVLAPNFSLNWQFYVFRPNLPNKYVVLLCGIHQTMYSALGWRKTEQYSNRKSKNFENITFLPIICKSVIKNPKNLSESEQDVSGGKKQFQYVLLK